MDQRLSDFLSQFNPPAGYRPWYGGASLFGTLRGLNAQQAAWQPPGHDHSSWRLVLHCAYSRYNIRRSFAGLQERGGFPRKGAYWADLPEVVNDQTWKEDVALLKKEHLLLVEAVKAFDPARLDEQATPASRFIDLLWGIVMHDLYHVGEMQVLKRLFLLNKERG